MKLVAEFVLLENLDFALFRELQRAINPLTTCVLTNNEFCAADFGRYCGRIGHQGAVC
jgi:hypothetical protein